MTDYNDGQWHAWNGGECPVHPETVVEVTYINGIRIEGIAKDRTWSDPNLFRVTKEHREPREFWISSGACFGTKEEAELRRGWPHLGEIIHVVEKPE